MSDTSPCPKDGSCLLTWNFVSASRGFFLLLACLVRQGMYIYSKCWHCPTKHCYLYCFQIRSRQKLTMGFAIAKEYRVSIWGSDGVSWFLLCFSDCSAMTTARYRPTWDLVLDPLVSCKLCLGEYPVEQMTTIAQCQCIFCTLVSLPSF